MRTLYTLLLALGVLMATGCSDTEMQQPDQLIDVDPTSAHNGQTDPAKTVPASNTSQTDPAKTTRQNTPVPHTHPAHFTECDLSDSNKMEMLWSDTQQVEHFINYNPRNATLAFSPNPGLLAHSPSGDIEGHMFRYVESGNKAFPAPVLGRYGADANWQVYVTVDQEKTQLRWMVTNKVMLERKHMPKPKSSKHGLPRFWSIITPNATRLTTLACYGETAIVTSYTLPEGEQGPVTQFDDFKCATFNSSVLMIPTNNGNGVLFAGKWEGVMTHVNLLDGSMTQTQAVPEHEPLETSHFTGTTVFDIAVHPEGKWVALSGSNGKIRFLSLPELKDIRDPIETHLGQVNLNTYMPDVVSPLAISPNGKFLAHVLPNGNPVIRDAETLDVLVTLNRPLIEKPNRDFNPENDFMPLMGNAALRFAFDKDTSALAILYYNGPTLYGCADWSIEGESKTLEVLIDGPTTGKIGEELTFVATHLGTDHVHGHQFFVNNVTGNSMNMGREFVFIPERKGQFDITVVIDDGFNTGEATMILTVE